MMDRLQRLGNLDLEHPLSPAVVIDSACGSCPGGCWRLRRTEKTNTLQLRSIDVPAEQQGAEIALSVSRSGLTRVSLLLFAPPIAALLLLAFVADRGISGWVLLGCGAAALSLALAISRSVVKPRVRRLLDVEARPIVSG